MIGQSVLRCMRVAAMALATFGCSPLAAQAPIAEQWRAIEVHAAPVTIEGGRVGALTFRGGLQLSSQDAMFGGLSGLEVLEGDRLLAISDYSDWFDAQLVLSPSGDLVGLEGVRTAMMRNELGAAFPSKDDGDSEGIAQLADGRIAVSFEQTQVVRIYDFNRDGPFGAASPGPQLAGVRRLRDNVGLEAIASAANGDLVVGAEGWGGRSLLWRAPLDSTTPTESRAYYRAEPGYSLTGLDRLPNGDFVALERFYAPVIGPRARITRFSEAALSAGGEVRGELLATLAPPLPVDNFEGVAAVEMLGVTRLYIVSDNNFSHRQRTLLLAFDLPARPEDFSGRTVSFERTPQR
jgi:hypothetical protein